MVERRHRHILDATRAIRFQVYLPLRFWGDCIKTVVYVINRVPSVVLRNTSPYEMLYEKTPLLDYFKVINYLCYVTMLPKGDKLAARALKVILLGYAVIQRDIRCMILQKGGC